MNPNHDAKGRFASKGAGRASGSTSPAQRLHKPKQATHKALWGYHDEAARYAAQDYTQHKKEWATLRNHARDGIDRLGTRHAMGNREFAQLRGRVRKLRVAEDNARAKAGLFG